MTKPPWIRIRPGEGPEHVKVAKILRERKLNTVCEEAKCPNRSECWGCGTATFLLMGRQCTRSCRFCSVRPGRAGAPLDSEESERVAHAVAELGLRFAVLTSVTRDDLADGGALHYRTAIEAIRNHCPGVGVEVLIPDYLGDTLATVVAAQPDVLAHNVEVVRELTTRVRDRRSSYERSLRVLVEAKKLDPELTTKSSLLLGLGETDAQVERAIDDLREAKVDILCLGQYLQPSSKHLPVQRYVSPERFAELERYARSGNPSFANVASGPLVRTSYRAADVAPQRVGEK